MKKALFFYLLLSLALVELQAQAWNKSKGSGYVQVSSTFLSYDRLLNGSEESVDLKRKITDNTVQLYGEIGLSNKLNAIVILPYKFTASSDNITAAKNDPFTEDTLESGSLNGFSNPELGIRFGLLNKSIVLSAQLTVGARLHQYDSTTGLQIGYDAWLVNPILMVGKGWSENYLQAGLGIRLNTGLYSQNFVAMIEGGQKFFDGKTFLALRFDVKIPLTKGTFDEGNAIQTALFRDNSSYISPGVKVIQSLSDHLFLNLAIYGAVYSEFEGGNATLNAAVAYEW
ncbi:MAG: hypothetical protein RIC15_08925 [Vicingaceae bacterium]